MLAFQDIRSTLSDRYPLARVLLYHCPPAVQGVGAAGSDFYWESNGFPGIANPLMCLIVGRGGGSPPLEDLVAV